MGKHYSNALKIFIFSAIKSYKENLVLHFLSYLNQLLLLLGTHKVKKNSLKAKENKKKKIEAVHVCSGRYVGGVGEYNRCCPLVGVEKVYPRVSSYSILQICDKDRSLSSNIVPWVCCCFVPLTLANHSVMF